MLASPLIMGKKIWYSFVSFTLLGRQAPLSKMWRSDKVAWVLSLIQILILPKQKRVSYLFPIFQNILQYVFIPISSKCSPNPLLLLSVMLHFADRQAKMIQQVPNHANGSLFTIGSLAIGLSAKRPKGGSS